MKKTKKRSKKTKKALPRRPSPMRRPKKSSKAKAASKQKHPKLSKKERQKLAAAEALVKKGRDRGFITYEDILKAFPDIETDIVFLDELYNKLIAAGVDVLEGGNLLDLDAVEEKVKGYGRESSSYDSIQMYLKEIGQYPLITAAMERELAKRIEKGEVEAENLLMKANLRLRSEERRVGKECRL